MEYPIVKSRRIETPYIASLIWNPFTEGLATEEENLFRREGAAIEMEADRIGTRPSGETDPTDPLVQRAMAVTRHFGEEPYLSRSSTNSNIPILNHPM